MIDYKHIKDIQKTNVYHKKTNKSYKVISNILFIALIAIYSLIVIYSLSQIYQVYIKLTIN